MSPKKQLRVRLPLPVLTDPFPMLSPGEAKSIKLSQIDRRAPFEFLYQSLISHGYAVADFRPDECDRYLSWTAKQLPDQARDKAIILEVGWIPRWTYQASPGGSNSQGHYAISYDYRPLEENQQLLIKNHLDRTRAIYARMVDDDAVERLRRRIGQPFFLFAFQLANDHNLRFSRTDFSQYYVQEQNKNDILAQACIDAIEGAPSPFPIIFKQHPFDGTPQFRQKISAKGIVLDNEDNVSTHELYATGLCMGAISINSNSLHEAVVWNIPALCLGSLIWNENTSHPPFPHSFNDLGKLHENKPYDSPVTIAYMYHLLKNQWTLTDFQNGLMVDALIETRGMCEPLLLRQALGVGN